MAEGHFAPRATWIRSASRYLMNTAEIQVMAGDFQGAREVLERFSAQHPGVDNARLLIAVSYVLEGRPNEALPLLRALEGRHPQAGVLASVSQARSGRRDEALRPLRPYEKRTPHSENLIAVVYVLLRDEAQTLLWMNRSVTNREPAAVYLAVNPAFALLRGNPSYEEIVRRSRLSH